MLSKISEKVNTLIFFLHIFATTHIGLQPLLKSNNGNTLHIFQHLCIYLKLLNNISHTPIPIQQPWLVMPLLKFNVHEQNALETSASKFLKFLQFISFIALVEKNGKLNFKFASLKSLLNVLLVVLLFSFSIICFIAFEHDFHLTSRYGTIVEIISFALINVTAIIPVLQPMILRYVKAQSIFVNKSW